MAMDSRPVLLLHAGHPDGKVRVDRAESVRTAPRYSQQLNLKMRVLAEELASTGELPGLDREHQPPPGDGSPL
jgi:hypothetical protein